MQGSHSKRSRATLIVLFAALVAAALALAAPAALATFPGQNGAIYFTRTNGTKSEVYAVFQRGKPLVRVTSSGRAADPSVSETSDRLVYEDVPSGANTTQLFVANASGEFPQQITEFNPSNDCCARASDPSLSPDLHAPLVAFTAPGLPPHQVADRLWVVDSQGRVAAAPLMGPGDTNQIDPDWAPDGSRIAFTEVSGGTGVIKTLDPPGGAGPPLVIGEHPSYAPTGSRIAFDIPRPTGGSAIETIPPDGGPSSPLLPFGSNPSYSPDGFRIAFAVTDKQEPADPGLWVADASDGTGRRRITDPPAGFVDQDPYWSTVSNLGGACDGLTAEIAGTRRDDVLVGTKRRDVISGRGGDDRIRGRSGDDLLCGGGGDDIVRGGSGRDFLRGGSGKNRLLGGPGRDRCPGSGGERSHSC